MHLLLRDLSSRDPIYHQALHLVEDGDCAALRKLLQEHQINPNTNECEFLRQAIVHNHPFIFWYLLPFYCKEVDKSDVLCEASSLNRSEFVVALLPLTDPNVNQSEPLMWAARHNNVDLMDRLLSISNVFDAIEQVNRYAEEPTLPHTLAYQGREYLQQYIALQINSGAEGKPKKI